MIATQTTLCVFVATKNIQLKRLKGEQYEKMNSVNKTIFQIIIIFLMIITSSYLLSFSSMSSSFLRELRLFFLHYDYFYQVRPK